MAKTLNNLHWVYPVANALGISYVNKTQDGVPFTLLENSGSAGQYICAPISGVVRHIEENEDLGGSNIEIYTSLADGSSVSNFFIGIDLSDIQESSSKLSEGMSVKQGQWIGRPRLGVDLPSNWGLVAAETLAVGAVLAIASVAFAPEIVFAQGMAMASRLAFLAIEPAVETAVFASMLPVIVGTAAAYEYTFSEDSPFPTWMTWVRAPGEKQGTYVWAKGLAQYGRGIDVLSKVQDAPKMFPEFSEGVAKAATEFEAARNQGGDKQKSKGMLMLAAAAAAYFYFKGK